MTTGWDGILDADEEILWQGRPDGKIIFRVRNIATFLFGLAFAGFALFWMILASTAGGFFWAFGLIHFFVGLGLSFGALFWSAYRRRKTWYTLTNKRAFIATHLPMAGKKLKSFPITPDTTLEIDTATPATIHFAEETKRSNNRSIQVKIGFERIENGREVYSLIRGIQEGER